MRKLPILVLAALLAPSAVLANGYVVANADGSVARSSGSIKIDHLGAGQYQVNNQTPVNGCAFIVTAGSSDTTIPAVTMATATGAREDRAAVRVATYDSDGNPADAGFHLIMQCTASVAPVWAVVDANGGLVRGLNATSANHTGAGTYTFTSANGQFSDSCAYTASIGLSGTSGVSVPGIVNVAALGGGTIAVRTYDITGAAADRGFHVFSACNL
ncbi:MAG: hypothetical protein JOZ72_00655 [Alphaproteobacteria bacterium]|nr:hypothetical protein [Alphaproteobacteria bacterium]